MKDYFEQIIIQAINNREQDVYLLPEDKKYLIKVHNGRRLAKLKTLSQEVALRLISYLKYISGMNIAETRRPQLGSTEFEYQGIKYPLRISTVSDFENRETVVIRIIYGNSQSASNWLNPSQFSEIEAQIPEHGLVLLVGPTGSGKTSTVHNLLNKRQENELILSIEDPVEIRSPNIVQLQVNEQAGMTYEELIKVALRHHPDVLVIGEIRDKKTATATIQAALSGHLVFATIHANSAKDAINRMIDLGADKNLIKNTLSLSIYQRLIPGIDQKLYSLVDIQDKYDLHNISFNFQKTWKENLKNAFEQKIIDSDVLEKYKKIA
ncbi:MAG: Flp pilus assembly complex ATPase component TadA [Lactobacillaceae bacterium]|jgi:competence protein ComGA|nr:Flp pilus assembly complex ATPase component TadA [Lactobacillaceae bacterium]